MSTLAEPEIAIAETAAPADRYPGAQPFGDTRLDWLRFRGRNQESDLLLHQLLGANLLILFGKPGLGKTSLLNARLFPLLRDRDFLPLPVRFNQTDSASPMKVFASAIAQACEAEQVDYTPGEDGGLWEFFKTAVFWREDRLQTPVLVLDQFEEIFTLQSAEFRTAVAAEIGELSSRRVPGRLRPRPGSADPPPFSDKAPEVKVLISLREDDLGMLQELTPQIPSILQNRFRLTPLNEDDARSAIIDPAKLLPGEVEFGTEPFDYHPATVEEITAAARRKEGGIDPFVLQLICSHVEKQVRQRQSHQSNQTAEVTVDSSYLGGQRGIRALAANFYLNAIGRLPQRRLRDRARDLCEDGLLTENGRRRSVDKEKLIKEFKLDETSLSTLERARLLRTEPRHGTHYYEISHDRIAEAVHQNRRWRMPREFKWGLSIALVLAITVALFQWNEARLARREFELAQTATRRVQQEKKRVLDLARFMDHLIADEFTDTPLKLRERVIDRLDDFYHKQGEPATHEERVRRMGHQMRKAMVQVEMAEWYEKGGGPTTAPDMRRRYIRHERLGAVDAFEEAIRHGEILAEEAPDDASVARDRIRSLVEMSKLFDQLGYPEKAKRSLGAAQTILEVLVRESPFAIDDFDDWMSLPKLETAQGYLPGENSSRSEAPADAQGAPPMFAPEQPYTNSIEMKFVPVPGTDVLFSVYETRVRDFRAFVRETGYVHMQETADSASQMQSFDGDLWKQRGKSWRDPGFEQTEDHPVVGVSWRDAKEFCKWLTLRERATSRLPDNVEYRLPTDHEWSVAVGLAEEDPSLTPAQKHRRIRGKWPWGKWPAGQPPPPSAGNYAGEEANVGVHRFIKDYNDGFVRTAPVGSFQPNEHGLFDLGGNVWEWCEDQYNPRNRRSDIRVLRGASWMDSARDHLVSSCRRHGPPGRRDNVGFRCVVGPAND